MPYKNQRYNSSGVGVVDLLARSMFRDPMFQVLDVLLGVPLGLKILKFKRILVLVITKSLVNLKSLALMVWSLLTFP